MDQAQEIQLLTTLARIDERTSKLDHIIMGNGQKGVLDRTTRLEEKQDELRADLEKFTERKIEEARQANELVVVAAKEEVKQETPTKGATRFAQVTSVAGFIAALVAGVLAGLKT